MMGFRQNAEAEKSRHLRVLILKFKAEAQQQCLLCEIFLNQTPDRSRQHLSVAAIFQQVILFVGKCVERHDSHKRTKDAFVDSNTTYAEVGGVKVVNANGTCLSCDSQAVACCRILMTFWHLEHPSRVGEDSSCLLFDALCWNSWLKIAICCLKMPGFLKVCSSPDEPEVKAAFGEQLQHWFSCSATYPQTSFVNFVSVVGFSLLCSHRSIDDPVQHDLPCLDACLSQGDSVQKACRGERWSWPLRCVPESLWSCRQVVNFTRLEGITFF